MTPSAPSATIAIIGGGYSGAVVAYNLARRLAGRVRIIVFEPRPSLGRGLAYSTQDPDHRINVPASRMSIRSDHVGDFADWIAQHDAIAGDPGALTETGHIFARRAVFGAYVESRLQPMLASGAIEHIGGHVTAIAQTAQGYRLTSDLFGTLTADIVVIATSHSPPTIPASLLALASSPRLIANPYELERFEQVSQNDRVLIVGSGLTSADIIASLARRGHRGRVTVLSRHGYRSQPHALDSRATPPIQINVLSATARGLVRNIRLEIARAGDLGLPWQVVLDGVRSQGQAIWQQLPAVERRRMLRHLRTLWDVHRFRIAPQLYALIAQRVALGKLRYRAGTLMGGTATGDHLQISFRPRYGSHTTHETFERVILATGPSHAAIRQSQPFLAELLASGTLTLDPNGLGLRTTVTGPAVLSDGSASPSLLVAGPLARGAIGELMGLPEVTRHAEDVANAIVEKLVPNAN